MLLPSPRKVRSCGKTQMGDARTSSSETVSASATNAMGCQIVLTHGVNSVRRHLIRNGRPHATTFATSREPSKASADDWTRSSESSSAEAAIHCEAESFCARSPYPVPGARADLHERCMNCQACLQHCSHRSRRALKASSSFEGMRETRLLRPTTSPRNRHRSVTVTPQSCVPSIIRQRASSERHGMTRKEQLVLYGRYGLVVTAFALITGIVAAPLLSRVWPQAAVVAQR